MTKLQFDYSKLRGRIVEKCGSQKALAEKTGITEAAISRYLNNLRGISQSNIMALARALDIPDEEVTAYFFSIKS